MPCEPTLIDSSVLQTDAYDDESMFAHSSAATAAARRTAALPVSVDRKLRSGVGMLRAHAVVPEKDVACASAIASASRPEALGPDPRGVLAELDERVGRGLHERRRPADVGQGLVARRPRELGQQLAVDAPRVAVPAVGLLAGERE